MAKFIIGLALAAAILLASSARAEPIKLKAAYFTSDRSTGYLGAVKPFVDAVNAAGNGLIEIETYTSGKLGRNLERQAQMVLDGTADIAFVVPGTTPERFPDNIIIELPGLYRNVWEASLIFTRLIETRRLKGYDDYFVIGAFASEPEIINTRKPIATLDDLKGLRIRVNNPVEALAAAQLGMRPVLMPINQVLNAITSDSIDGAAIAEAMLIEFGIGRVTTYHYRLPVGQAPLALLMSRKKFESLPQPAQDIVRKYSGQWAAERFAKIYAAENEHILANLKEDPRRLVINPSPTDLHTAQLAFDIVVNRFAAKSPHNQALLKSVRAELAKLRTTE